MTTGLLQDATTIDRATASERATARSSQFRPEMPGTGIVSIANNPASSLAAWMLAYTVTNNVF
jgi:hypothetical protein